VPRWAIAPGTAPRHVEIVRPKDKWTFWGGCGPNLIEALSIPDDDEDDALDEEIHAALAKRGLTLDTWAAQIRAQAQAVVDQNRRTRRGPT
jgi:hypothetical protein